MVMRSPMGLPSGQYSRAMAWLMITTPGAPVVSCSVKERPRTEGIFEDVEIVGGNGRKAAAAVRRTFERSSFDDEPETKPTLQRHAATRRRRFDFRQRLQSFPAIAHQLTDGRGVLEARAGQRHPHREHALCIELQVRRHEGRCRCESAAPRRPAESRRGPLR